MRFLLRPGWIALVVAVIGFAVAAFTLLAPWQFGREAQRDAQQQAIDAASTTAPVPLAELVPPGGSVTSAVEWRQVTVTGTYVPDGEGLVRLRVVDGQPAVEVLTPFRTDDGRLITVNRGSAAAASGATVPDYAAPPAGPVTLTGRLRLDETDPQGRAAIETDGHRQIYASDSRALAAATGLPLEPGFLQLTADQPGVLRPLEVAPTAGGDAPFTNFSYALQWITFGVIALVALGLFVRLELLQRRGPDRRSERAALRRALAGDDEPGPR
ncbi:SURF1 family protein [Pseudonocardia cypriaca]|uniref:SURF1-like protein n=1 Tax=Pseudonocardia cypriaca TaxID=882449 RepID=A0A543GEH9_9PSEU|nr:SURF1 family cytochrome oxidase biogenesis protein [Pseudonocardia cypriaca]TQM44492.1 cytochrome oxidase assembly protein ShyY1 [Pseudonocardia cypriaca]